LLSIAHELIDVNRPQEALIIAQWIQARPHKLDEPREADAVAAAAMAELGECNNAIALIEGSDVGIPAAARLTADFNLVRLRCALLGGDKDKALFYLQQIIKQQGGKPAAARARAMFNRAASEEQPIDRFQFE